MFLVLFMYLLFSLTFVVGKAGLQYLSPVLFVAIRMLIGGPILLAIQRFYYKEPIFIDKKDYISFFNVSLFLIYISFLAEFWALQYVSPAKTALLYDLSPFMTALIAYFLISEKLTKKQWFGLCIGFFGFIPTLLDQQQAELFTQHISFLSMPEIALLLAVAASSYGWILSKQLMVERQYRPITINGVTMLIGGVMAFVTSLIYEGVPTLMINKNPLFWSPYYYSLAMAASYTLLLILIANIAGFNLYAYLLRQYSATFLSFAGFTTPIFAAFFDLLLFKEPVPLTFYITILLVFWGLWLFYQDELFVANK